MKFFKIRLVAPGFFQNRADSDAGVLEVRSGRAVEIDGFLSIESDGFSWRCSKEVKFPRGVLDLFGGAFNFAVQILLRFVAGGAI